MTRHLSTAAVLALALGLTITPLASPFLRSTEAPVPAPSAHYGREVVATLDTGFLDGIMGKSEAVLFDVPLAGDGHADVELTAFSPFAPGCRITEMSADGPIEHAVPSDRRYFRAKVLTPSEGFGLFVFQRGDFSGFLHLDGLLYLYGVMAAPGGQQLAASCRFAPDAPPPSYQICDNALLDNQAPLGDISPEAVRSFEFSTTPLQANLAIEMDYESFDYFNSVSASVNYAADLIAAGSVIYQADIFTTLGIANIRVWSTSADPYRDGTSTSALLGDLKAEYTAHMGSVSRASAMLLSKRNMGGIAYVQALCSNTYGYAVCGINGNYSYPTSAYTWDANCTTHELGHNFASHHTHCYGPADGLPDWVDKCYNGEGGCFSGTTENPPLAEKTLMSYCHLKSPGTVSLTFKDRYNGSDGQPGVTRAIIRAGAEGSACLLAPACAFTCAPNPSATTAAPPATINFTANPVAVSCVGTPAWSWTFGDGGTSTSENPSHSYPTAGNYNWSVTGTLAGKTCTGSGTIAVTGCTLTCTATVPATATTTTPASFSGTATAGPTCTGTVTYDWNFGDGTTHGTSASVNHLYSTAGSYTWTLTTAVGSTTCTKTGTITVTATCTLTCTATVPPTGEAGAPVSFQSTATPSNCSGGVTYTWNFGDGTTSTSQNASHTYAASGNYTWFLTAKVGSSTCSKSGSIAVAKGCLLSNCTATATPSSGSAPLSVTFTASATATDCSAAPAYAWTFGDGASSTSQNPGHSYASAGSYAWTVTISADGRTCSQTGTVTVTAPCALSCEASATPTSGVAPLAVSFTATATPVGCAGSPAFAWAFGDGATSAQQNPSHTYGSSGSFSWTLTVSQDGQTCTQTGTVTVIAPCALSCEASANPASGVAPLAVAFTATATPVGCAGSPAFAWAFGDGASSTEQNPSHTYATAGNYPWTLTVSQDGQICTQTGTVTVIAPCALSCEASATPTSGVAPLAAAFTATATPVGCAGSPAFAWVFGDGGTSTEQNPSHTYTSAGSFSWTLSVSQDGQTCSQTGTVTVSEPCTVTCQASATPTSGIAPLAVAFASTATPAGCSGSPAFAWSFGDGATSTEQNPSHSYAAAGNFPWTLTVTVDGKTCTQTGAVVVSEECALSCDASAEPSAGPAPLTVAFAATATPAGCAGSPAFAWSFGDGATSTEQNTAHTYTEAGTHTWTLTAAVGGQTCTRTGTVTVTTSGKPGDCDGSGNISIGEVQKGINMFLGLTAPDCGVNCSGTGTVTIGEVQKVINGFLGLPASC